jgi:hypothetical protein
MVDAKMTDLETTYRPDGAVKVLNRHHTGTPEVIEFGGEVFDNRRSVDALMGQLAETKKTAERLRADCKDMAESVIVQADIDWQWRSQYPRQQVKYDRDIAVARQYVDTPLNAHDPKGDDDA